MLRLFILLWCWRCGWTQHSLNNNNNNNQNMFGGEQHLNPSLNSYHHGHNPPFTNFAGREFQLRVREPDQRNPYHCEPYEDMYVDDEDCHVYCMVNGKIGSVVLRDQIRRRLYQCVSSLNPCSICRRRIFVNGLPPTVNATLPGRCSEHCRCLASQMSPSQLQELSEQCNALKTLKFQPIRNPIQGNYVDGFEVKIPMPEQRDRTRCEPYESATYNLPVGSQEVYDLQCRTHCVISGTVGTIAITAAPRLLGFSASNRCRQPTGTSLFRGIEVHGSQEQLLGFCHRGSCDQLSRTNLRPRTTSGRPGTAGQSKDSRIKKEVNVTEVYAGITIQDSGS